MSDEQKDILVLPKKSKFKEMPTVLEQKRSIDIRVICPKCGFHNSLGEAKCEKCGVTINGNWRTYVNET